MSQAITRVLTRGAKNDEVSREEITAMTSAGQRLGIIEEDETRVVSNLFRLPEMKAEEVMTPRMVIDSLSADATVGSVVEASDKFAHSRLPVTGETIDTVQGFVLVREILLAAVRGETDRKVSDFVREIPRITEHTDLDALLDLLMESERHIALVQDEYGGTAGLITMEDVLETLLGSEIVDEHDEAPDLRLVAKARAKQQQQKRTDKK